MNNPFKYINQYTFGDSLEYLKQIPNNCVDLIFTSPPDLSQTEYDKEGFKQFINLFLSEFNRIVRPTGFIVISQQDRRFEGEILSYHNLYINQLIELGFKIKDEKILIRNKAERVDLYKFTYQYFTCFTKRGTIATNKRTGRWLQDIIIDKEQEINGQYIWSLDFCSLVINTLTEERDWVVDPFAGYGPVLFSAQRENRLFWGGENDKTRYNKNFEFFTKQIFNHI